MSMQTTTVATKQFLYKKSFKITTPAIETLYQIPSYGFNKALLSYALDNCPNEYVREVLLSAPLQHNRKRIIVDVKYHDIQSSESTCIPGWHCDGVENPFHNSRPDIYHLFVVGPDGSRTLFLDEDITLDYTENMSMYDLRKGISDDVKVVEIPDSTFFTYDRFQFHQGRVVTEPTKRLLIRLCETDLITPVNTITKKVI